jgi:hypothetical protein
MKHEKSLQQSHSIDEADELTKIKKDREEKIKENLAKEKAPKK